jgi:hypothetical protein
LNAFIQSPFDWEKCKFRVLSKTRYFIVHIDCNKQDAQVVKAVSAKERKILKNSMLPALYNKYLEMSKILTKKLRSTYKLSSDQYASIFNIKSS